MNSSTFGQPALRRSAKAMLLGALMSVMWACKGADAQSNPVALDSIGERVKPCFACHGPQGQASSTGYLPRIAGKPAAYLYNQLRNFRDGKRNNDRMVQMVQFLSDDYLLEMARYFSGLELPYGVLRNPALVATPAAVLQRGETLARMGDKQKELPACIECHGEALTGRLPAIPGLLGLPRDYLVAQIGAWNNGQRHAIAPDCMKSMASRLSTADLYAVSSWLALQEVPARAQAVAPDAKPLPFKCGSAAP
jgi:cytochrome c553